MASVFSTPWGSASANGSTSRWGPDGEPLLRKPARRPGSASGGESRRDPGPAGGDRAWGPRSCSGQALGDDPLHLLGKDVDLARGRVDVGRDAQPVELLVD